MVYANYKDYFEGEIKTPLKQAIKKKDNKSIDECIDYIQTQLAESNAVAKAYEEVLKAKGIEIDFKEMQPKITEWKAKYLGIDK